VRCSFNWQHALQPNFFRRTQHSSITSEAEEKTMSTKAKLITIALVAPLSLLLLMACSHLVMITGAHKPAADQFGFGPRTSAAGKYKVSIEENAPYKVGKLLSTVVTVHDANGQRVEGAQIRIGGGMPQHGHGLPTKPRVSKGLGDGRYQVDGLKFNMGGWWELKFAIAAGAVTDSVTFNLDL
jgi:hypothetical protein